MFLATFPVGAFQCNCSILGDEKSFEAIIVDPGDEAQKIVGIVTKHGFTVKYLVHTHAHLDHIGATRAVHASLGGEVCLNKDDQFLYDNIAMQGQVLGMEVDPEVTAITRYIEHHDEISASGINLKVLHTPGHTPGSVCFYLANSGGENNDKPILFSGDTLFMGSIGRTDLWGGDYHQIIASLKERVVTLPEPTVVITGHGPKTTIARERHANPFLA